MLDTVRVFFFSVLVYFSLRVECVQGENGVSLCTSYLVQEGRAEWEPVFWKLAGSHAVFCILQWQMWALQDLILASLWFSWTRVPWCVLWRVLKIRLSGWWRGGDGRIFPPFLMSLLPAPWNISERRGIKVKWQGLLLSRVQPVIYARCKFQTLFWDLIWGNSSRIRRPWWCKSWANIRNVLTLSDFGNGRGVGYGEMVRRRNGPTPILLCFWSCVVNSHLVGFSS